MTKREWMMNLSLLLGVIIISLVLLEIILRLITPSPLYPNNGNKDFTFYEYDETLGWKNKPNTEGPFVMSDSKSLIKINSQGLRDDETMYERKDNQTLRIQIYGDSMTWGFGVNKTERYTEFFEATLQKKLQKPVEVINFGVSGYSTDQELLLLKTEGIKYDTDIIIFALFDNDIPELGKTEVSSYSKPKFVLQEGVLALTHVPVPQRAQSWEINAYDENKFLSKVHFFLKKSKAYHTVQRLLFKLSFISDLFLEEETKKENEENLYGLHDALLREAKKISEEQENTFVLFLLPRYEEVYQNEPAKTLQQIASFAEQEEIIYSNALPYLQEQGKKEKDFYFDFDRHWNTKGNRVIGEFFADELIRMGIVEHE